MWQGLLWCCHSNNLLWNNSNYLEWKQPQVRWHCGDWGLLSSVGWDESLPHVPGCDPPAFPPCVIQINLDNSDKSLPNPGYPNSPLWFVENGKNALKKKAFLT